MGLLDRFKKKNFTFANQTDNLPGKHSSFYGKSYNPELDDLYRLAYPNISVIARRASTVKINVSKVDDEDYIYTPESHWLAYLFSDPSKLDTYKTFIDGAIKSSIMFPNTFIIFTYNSVRLRNPVSMRVAGYNEVRAKVVGGIFKGWEIAEPSGAFRLLDDKEVLHIKEWNPVDQLNGFAPINAAYQFLTLQQTIYMHQRGVFSRPIPSGAYVIEANDADFHDITSKITAQLKNPDSSNIQFVQKRPGTNSESVTFEKYAQDNRSLAMAELFENTNQRVDDAFGVPKQMKGDVEATNLAGVRVADSIFMKNVVLPKVENIIDAFNNWLQVNFSGENVKLIYEADDIEDPEENKIKAETLKVNIETVKLMQDAGISEDTIQELVGLDIKFTGATNSESKDTEPQAEPSQKEAKGNLIKPLVTKSVPLSEASQDERQKYITKMDKVFTEHLKSLEKEVLRLQTKGTKAVKSIQDINQIDIEADTKALYDELFPIFIAYMGVVSIQQFNDAVRSIGKIPATGGLTESIKNQYGTYLYRLLTSWHKDLTIDLSNISNDAVTNNLTYNEAKSDIIKYFSSEGEYTTTSGKVIKNNAVYRANRLIRTENVRAGNYASIGSMTKIQNSLGVSTKFRTTSRPE